MQVSKVQTDQDMTTPNERPVPPLCHSGRVPDPSADALLGLLHPAWRALIAVCLLLVTVVGVWRLAGRGPTRMVSAVYFTGFLIVAITVVGTLAVSCTTPQERHRSGEIPSPAG